MNRISRKVFSRCDECHALAYHAVVGERPRTIGGRYYKEVIAECSVCGAKFVAMTVPVRLWGNV